MNATGILSIALDSTIDTLRIERTPGGEGQFRAVCLTDGSSAPWVPAALVGLGAGTARMTFDGRLVSWRPAT